MAAPLRICRGRGLAVVLASGAAISLSALSGGLTGGMAPALAAPITETSAPTTAAPAPNTAVAPGTRFAPSEPAVVPQAPATVEAPTQTQATHAPSPPPEPVTQVPIVTREPEVVTTTATAPVTAPVATPPAPATTTAPSPQNTARVTAPAPVTTNEPATTTSAPGTTTRPTTTAKTGAGQTPTAGTPPSPTAAIGTNGSAHPSTPITAPAAVPPTPPTTLHAGPVTKTAQPDRVQAVTSNIEIAKASTPVEQKPDPAPSSEVDRIRKLLNSPTTNPNVSPMPSLVAEHGGDWDHKVRQWQPDWVRYDDFYRPVIFNPYPGPLQVVYIYGGVPRILLISPLGSSVLDVPDLGAYGFTATALNADGAPTDVAVGNFFGGGYYPGPDAPPPPPPPPVVRYDDVPVVVKYTNAVYQPFQVNQIVDVGHDPVEGEQKVLIDGVTPAWGVWQQTDNGGRQFEVHKTQQFPGLDNPQEGPLPGNYQLQLASASSPTGFSTKDVLLIAAAAVVGTMGLAAIFLTVFLGRRRPHH